MGLPTVISYEIKESRTGHKVPVVNGVHLHSIYDPTKESINFIEKNKELLDRNNWVIFLGLGFGYHINEAIKYLEGNNNEKYKILVIEPNCQVCQDAMDLKLIDGLKVTFLTAIEVRNLYKDRSLINVLLQKPSIIAHPASFNLYRDYFTEFLTFKSLNTIGELEEIIEDQELKKYLKEFNLSTNFEEILSKAIPNKFTLSNDLDFFMLAYKHLSKQAYTKMTKEKS